MHDGPLGIFDSGIGGLTVFCEIERSLPSEDLIYLGDTARVPYGTKSAATVTRYAVQGVEFLLRHKVKLIVVACNTASALSLPELQKRFPVPILGVIGPGAKGALKVSRSYRIGVIGTEGTIRSEAYPRAVVAQEPRAVVTSKACPLLVPLVEEGWLTGEVTERTCHQYLEKILLEKTDTLILGCTHYPLLKKVLQQVVGPKVNLIDSGEEAAGEVKSLLRKKGLLRKENGNPRREFFVTDSPERFRRVGELFLKQPLRDVHPVTLES